MESQDVNQTITFSSDEGAMNTSNLSGNSTHLEDEDMYEGPPLDYQLQMQDLMPEELPEHIRPIFTIIYVVIVFVGFSGNFATAIVIIFSREMKTVTNVFLLSLAISDALIAIVNIPVQLNFYLKNEWTLGNVLCKFSPYIQGVVIVSSILTLTTLGLDRYYAICHPLRARHVHTITRAIVLVAVIWFVSSALLVPQIFIQKLEQKLSIDFNQNPPIRSVYMCVEYFSDHRLAVAYSLFFHVVLYFIPVVIMCTTYGTIAVKLWRRVPIGEPTTTENQPGGETSKRLKEKKRVVCMLVLIVALFAISWFPFFSWQLFILFSGREEADGNPSYRIAYAFSQVLGYSNCCVNPIIYCFMNERFQKNFFKIICCKCLIDRRRRRRYSCATDGDRSAVFAGDGRNKVINLKTTTNGRGTDTCTTFGTVVTSSIGIHQPDHKCSTTAV